MKRLPGYLAALMLFLFISITSKATAMPWWDDIDDTFKHAKSQFEKFYKNFEFSPLISISEDKKSNLLEFELDFAGYDKDDISIEITDGIIKVSATKKETREETESTSSGEKRFIFKSSRESGKVFRHSIKKYDVDLSDPKAIKSSYKNGILKISIPFKKNARNTVKLEIESEDDLK